MATEAEEFFKLNNCCQMISPKLQQIWSWNWM